MATGDRLGGPASGDGEFDDDASGVDQRLSDLLAPLIDDLIPSYSLDRAATPDLPPPSPDDLSAAITAPSAQTCRRPQSGRGGSGTGGDNALERPTAADLMRVLGHTLLIPVAPPLRQTDPRAVMRWAEAASEALRLRRERQRLIREVLNVLDDEWVTAEAAKRLREQIASREAVRRRREAGTYWQQREAGRRSRRPVRIEVDVEAWRQAKEVARQLGIGLGEYVGQVVRDHLATPLDDAAIARLNRTRRRHTDRERIFLRVDVSSGEWEGVVVRVQDRRTTLLRYLGALVEAAVWEERTLTPTGDHAICASYHRSRDVRRRGDEPD